MSRTDSRLAFLGLASWVVALALGAYACSSDAERQDQSYGTDAGANYQGPEAGIVTDGPTQSDKDARSGDDGATDAIFDGTPKDTSGSADASVESDLGGPAQSL